MGDEALKILIFKDFYSKHAEEYSVYRPYYPEKLFQFLNSIVDRKSIAVDCATGNGQAALGLSKFFDKVIALDASKAQIRNAFQNPAIEYKVATVEDTGLADNIADLVTIATAVHWVNTDLFYKEVRRILKDNGVIAIWTYSTTCIIDPEIDELVNSFSERMLNVHWDDGIKKVWDFDKISFPFKKISAPDFEIRKDLTCDEFLNYMFTWSSVQKYIEVQNSNPLDLFEDNLKKVWGNEIKREVVWNIKMKAGKIVC